ncbi:unnamed protein product [Lactuca virosa]|uniref:RRM domain-containing protein n=1 Tax=Lactuca virosa TaxID=75947 RepID=A0AAU9M4M8_9ASTR|nr:unnamed protein product [Lactuca virosa]
MVNGRKLVGKQKPPHLHMEKTHVVSYYVSNLPEGVRKFKIRKVFEVFGKVVDIYIGGKRDRFGSIFAFVRFEGVRDPKSLEKSMARIRCEHCILKVNIARYKKQPNLDSISNANMPKPPLPPPTHNHNFRTRVQNGLRTYAEKVAGSCFNRAPVHVKPSVACLSWDECVLSGEVISAQHISNMPTLLKLDSNVSGRIYYTGGLKMLIRCINPQEADAFYDNAENWNSWFSWLKKGFDDSAEFEIITWVRIYGVPTRF